MKKIFTLLFLFTAFSAYSQECEKYISTETDKVTGKSYTGSVEAIEIKNAVNQTLRIKGLKGLENTLILSFSTENLSGCVDDKNEINILFKDETRLVLNGMVPFNCDGRSAVYFSKLYRNKDAYSQLKNKPVDIIRFHGRKDYVEVTLSPENQAYLMGFLACLDPFIKK